MFSVPAVCQEDYGKTTGPISRKFQGSVQHGPRKKPLHFGADEQAQSTLWWFDTQDLGGFFQIIPLCLMPFMSVLISVTALCLWFGLGLFKCMLQCFVSWWGSILRLLLNIKTWKKHILKWAYFQGILEYIASWEVCVCVCVFCPIKLMTSPTLSLSFSVCLTRFMSSRRGSYQKQCAFLEKEHFSEVATSLQKCDPEDRKHASLPWEQDKYFREDKSNMSRSVDVPVNNAATCQHNTLST